MCAHINVISHLSSGSGKPEISELHKHIVPKYAARWRDLGVQLKIPEHHLNTIAVDNTNHPFYSEQCCKGMLQKWMEITLNPTWIMLQMAIGCLSDLSDEGTPRM